MVHIVVGKSLFLNLFRGQIFGKLVDDGTDHFGVPQFFCTYVGQYTADFSVGVGVSLGQIPLGGSQFSIRTTK